jgi:Plasmid encoded RepA protein
MDRHEYLPSEVHAGALLRSVFPEFVREELEEARSAGEVGYMARIVVQANLPHSDPHTMVFERTNGELMTLRMTALSRAGLPYGTLPRLLLAWLTTEAVRTKERELSLGHTLSEFLDKLELGRRGGARGDITRLRAQMRRLFSTAVSVDYSDPHLDAFESVTIADRTVTWWDPKRPDQGALWGSSITLSERFFREVTTHPVPLDMSVLRSLRRSPLALDIYAWLTWRMSFLRGERTIPWEYLQGQFGSDYKRQRAFRDKFKRALADVVERYPEARCRAEPRGLILLPSATSVRRRAPRPR